MIPKTSGTLQNTITFAVQSSKTVALDMERERLEGYTDGIAAVKQAVYIILNVERYDYLIHSWNFGVELKGLFGKPMNWVMPEAKRRIREALMMDDRITEVDEFVMQADRHALNISFTVHSIFGDFEGGTSLNV